LAIFKLVSKAAEGLTGSTIASPPADPAPQPSEEVLAIAEEPRDETAATPSEVGLAAAAAGTNDGDVV
jgi:hypothetical protein